MVVQKGLALGDYLQLILFKYLYPLTNSPGVLQSRFIRGYHLLPFGAMNQKRIVLICDEVTVITCKQFMGQKETLKRKPFNIK